MADDAPPLPPAYARGSLGQLRSLLRSVARTAIERRIDVQAAQLAFNGVYSLGPLLAVASSALALVPTRVVRTDVLPRVIPIVPHAVRPLLNDLLSRAPAPPSPVLLALGTAGLLWTLSSSMGAIGTALEALGWKPVQGFLRQRVRAMVLGLLASLGVASAALTAAVGPSVLWFVQRSLGVDLSSMHVVAWLRWPIIALVYGTGAAFQYRYASAHRPLWGSVFVGGATAGAVCMASTYGLRVLFAYVPNMGGAHGAAGAVFAALFWLYVMAIGLMLGAVVTQAHESLQLGRAARRGTHRALRDRGRARAQRRARRRRARRERSYDERAALRAPK